MSDKCASANPQGKNKSCSSIKEKITNFVIQLPSDAGFAPIAGQTLNDINDVANWESRFNSGAMYRFTKFAADAEKSGGDPVTVTNGSDGSTKTIRFNAQGFSAYFESNECDYAELKRVFRPGREFQVWEETKNFLGGWKLDKDGVPEIKGRTAEVVANPNNAAVADENTDFMVMINYKDQEEADYGYVIEKPAQFGLKAEAAIPVGYNLEKIDTSTITAAIVLLSERCGDAVTGVAETDFYIDGVALGVGDITDNGDGTYTTDLTGVKKLQVSIGTAPDIEYKSNVLYI